MFSGTESPTKIDDTNPGTFLYSGTVRKELGLIVGKFYYEKNSFGGHLMDEGLARIKLLMSSGLELSVFISLQIVSVDIKSLPFLKIISFNFLKLFKKQVVKDFSFEL